MKEEEGYMRLPLEKLEEELDKLEGPSPRKWPKFEAHDWNFPNLGHASNDFCRNYYFCNLYLRSSYFVYSSCFV
jgi:hypothetical protein